MSWLRKGLGFAFLTIGALSFVFAFIAREPARDTVAEPVAGFGVFDGGLPIPVDLDLAWSEAQAGVPGAKPAVARRTNDREHLRDLMLQAVLTAWGGDAASVALALHDANGPREPYLNTTAQPQHGPTRHAVLEDDVTVLLIPSDASESQRHDWIAQTADHMKVKTTQAPSAIVVFEYCIDDPVYVLIEGDRTDLFATLRRAETVPGDALYTEAYGYVERTVRDGNGLDAFLDAADDLIAIEPAREEVTLSGRDYRARAYGRVTSEHVATLWKAYGEIDRAQTRRSQRLGRIVSDLANERIGEMLMDQLADAQRDPQFQNQGLDPLRVLRGTVPLDVRRQIEEAIRDDISEIFDIYGTCQWEWLNLNAARTRASDLLPGQEPIPAEFLDLIDRIERSESDVDLRERSLLRGALGFSLDTEYHYDVLTERFDAFMEDIDNPIVQILRAWDEIIDSRF